MDDKSVFINNWITILPGINLISVDVTILNNVGSFLLRYYTLRQLTFGYRVVLSQQNAFRLCIVSVNSDLLSNNMFYRTIVEYLARIDPSCLFYKLCFR